MTFYGLALGLFRAVSALLHPLRAEGLEKLPEGGFVLCANHKSFRDPLVLGAVLPRKVRFMAKKELFQGRLASKIMTGLGAFPVDRGGTDLAAMRQAISVVKDGEILGVFPEGHRYSDGQLHELKTGTALIVVRTGAPVVPAAIVGKYRLFRPVRVRIGAPLRFDRIPGKTAGEQLSLHTERLAESIRSLLKGC